MHLALLRRSSCKRTDVFQILPLLANDCYSLLTTLLTGRYGRKLTKDQLNALTERLFVDGASPMFVQLLASFVRHWTSTDVVDEWLDQFPTTLDEALECLLMGLEQCYGDELVARTLGLMTLAQLGLTDAELDDALSLDDAVFEALPSSARPAVR